MELNLSPGASPQPAEELLQLQAAILRQVTDSVIVTDLHWTITYWNESASAVFGYTAQEMLGKSTALLYPARDETHLASARQRILAGSDYVGEWQGRRKDSSLVWVDVKTTLLRDTQGRAIGLIGIAKDITARKQLTEEIALAKEQLEAILHNVADGILVADPAGRVVYVNEITARTFGFPSAASLLAAPRTSLSQFFSRVPAWDERGRPLPFEGRPIVQALRGTPAQALMQYQDLATDQRRWVLVRAQPIVDAQGQVPLVVSVYVDLTEQKELELRKDHFISMVSHELKTPLTVLSAYTQLLLERFAAEGRQDAVRQLSKMDDQITTLTKLVSDLLDISRLQADQFELAQEAVDLDALVREVVENLQPTTTHRLLIEGTAQRPINGDKDHLGQVLVNLLTNAIKYSPHADTVVVRVSQEHEQVIVSVQDFGIGIAQSHQQRIFERFYRVLSKQDQTYPGLGIGLYIVYEIIGRHGGKIWVESAEGEGSTFSFSLPVRDERESALLP